MEWLDKMAFHSSGMETVYDESIPFSSEDMELWAGLFRGGLIKKNVEICQKCMEICPQALWHGNRNESPLSLASLMLSQADLRSILDKGLPYIPMNIQKIWEESLAAAVKGDRVENLYLLTRYGLKDGFSPMPEEGSAYWQTLFEKALSHGSSLCANSLALAAAFEWRASFSESGTDWLSAKSWNLGKLLRTIADDLNSPDNTLKTINAAGCVDALILFCKECGGKGSEWGEAMTEHSDLIFPLASVSKEVFTKTNNPEIVFDALLRFKELLGENGFATGVKSWLMESINTTLSILESQLLNKEGDSSHSKERKRI